MIVLIGDERIEVAPGEPAVFGRSDQNAVTIGADPPDAAVSRRAGRLEHLDGRWRVFNIGRRSFYVVLPSGEVELQPDPDGPGIALLQSECWLRIPGTDFDHAVVLQVPEDERPPPLALDVTLDGQATVLEEAVTLTPNELRSVVAVYENYLLLPPAYRREPNGFRAAAARLGVAEGKVKADLRRVQQKVADSGGPRAGGSRYRDALIDWLLGRGIVSRADLALLDDSSS